MAPWRELLLSLLLLVALSLAAGAAVMALHGLLLRSRLRCTQSLAECAPPGLLKLGIPAVFAVFLLLTQTKAVPWEWLATLPLLVATAPVLLAWLGPPDEHVEACRLCQIGRGSAYSHYYGYLRLMRDDHGVCKRLQNYERTNPAGLPDGDLAKFFSDAVVVLAPTDGEYPDCSLTNLRNDELRGVSSNMGSVPHFQCMVGGNKRTYGEFSVHRVTSSYGMSRCVALDKVGALGTLRKLREHGPAGLSRADCRKQMRDMMEELEKIVANRSHLRGQVKVVSYEPGQHVGDAILAAIADGDQTPSWRP